MGIFWFSCVDAEAQNNATFCLGFDRILAVALEADFLASSQCRYILILNIVTQVALLLQVDSYTF